MASWEAIYSRRAAYNGQRKKDLVFCQGSKSTKIFVVADYGTQLSTFRRTNGALNYLTLFGSCVSYYAINCILMVVTSLLQECWLGQHVNISLDTTTYKDHGKLLHQIGKCKSSIKLIRPSRMHVSGKYSPLYLYTASRNDKKRCFLSRGEKNKQYSQQNSFNFECLYNSLRSGISIKDLLASSGLQMASTQVEVLWLKFLTISTQVG